jgi:hypothetical protein
VPVDRKKLNKRVKNNFFCFLSKSTYDIFTYISHTYTLAGRPRILPPLLNRVLWMLLCICQNISEAPFTHLHLFPDLLERDVGLPQLKGCSLLSLRERLHSGWHASG